MHLMFVGDLHGNLERAYEIIDLAVKYECPEIVQVGDWGFIWGTSEAYKRLSKLLVKKNIHMRFCDGNHDVHPALRALERDVDNNVAPNITYQFRGSMKILGGSNIVFLGGAPSIDKKFRIAGESWWPEEYITDEDVEAALKWSDKNIHILVTHDAPVKPEGFKETSDMSFNYHSEQSIESIMKVVKGLKPKMLIHGHYHYKYYSRVADTVVYGLDSDGGHIWDNCSIVNTMGD